MSLKEIIDGLKFTVDMFLFDPSTGETITEPRNDMDKTTIDACKGAIELLEHTRWIPCSERLPDKYTYTLWCASSGYVRGDYFNGEFWEDAKKYCYEVIAWMPLPEPYKSEMQ